MTMADTIAVMNARPDRAARHADRALRAAAARRSSPASSASRTCSPAPSTADGARARSTDGARCASARRARRPHRPRSRSASGPRRCGSAARAANRLTGAVARDAPTSASRRSTSSRHDRRRASPSIVQNTEPGAATPAAASRSRSAGARTATFVVDHTEEERHDRSAHPPSSCCERAALRRAALLSLPGLLAACGGSSGIEAGRQPTTDGRARSSRSTLRFSNWPLYIDIDEKTKKRPTLDAVQGGDGRQGRLHRGHQRQRGVLREDPGPALAGPVDRPRHHRPDRQLRFPGRMIELGYVEKLDKARSRTSTTSSTRSQHPSFDPNREYSLPWQSGMTGIAYDPTKRHRRRSRRSTQLLEDPKLKGKVTMLDRDGRHDRRSSCSRTATTRRRSTDATFNKAIDADPEGRRHRARSASSRATTTRGLLAKGDIWACDGLVGRHRPAAGRQPEPQVGTSRTPAAMIWTDNMLIPTGGDVFTASTFMNFVYDPKIAAQIEAYVNYICPVKGAKEEIAKIDPELASNPLIFPTADDARATSHDLRRRGARTTRSTWSSGRP